MLLRGSVRGLRWRSLHSGPDTSSPTKKGRRSARSSKPDLEPLVNINSWEPFTGSPPQPSKDLPAGTDPCASFIQSSPCSLAIKQALSADPTLWTHDLNIRWGSKGWAVLKMRHSSKKQDSGPTSGDDDAETLANRPESEVQGDPGG